jgi:uridine kinase
MLKSQLGQHYQISAHLLSLINYYHPVRGNMRRRSRADSKNYE